MLFTCIQPLQIAFGYLSVIWHASPAFGVIMTVFTRVNLVAVIRIVEAHLMTIFFDFFPIEGVCKGQSGHETGADAVPSPEPDKISDF